MSEQNGDDNSEEGGSRLAVPNGAFNVTIGTSSGLLAVLSAVLIIYSCVSSPKLRDNHRFITVYSTALGFTGFIQSLWGAYTVLGEVLGYWLTQEMGLMACVFVGFLNKSVEGLPFLLFMAYCLDMSRTCGLSPTPPTKRPPRGTSAASNSRAASSSASSASNISNLSTTSSTTGRRIRRATLVVFIIFMIFLAINLITFITVEIQAKEFRLGPPPTVTKKQPSTSATKQPTLSSWGDKEGRERKHGVTLWRLSRDYDSGFQNQLSKTTRKNPIGAAARAAMSGQPRTVNITFCVTTLDHTIQLSLHSLHVSLYFILPFLVVLMIHFTRLLSPTFRVRYVGTLTLSYFFLRWLTWLPLQIHSTLVNLGLLHKWFKDPTPVENLWYVSLMMAGVGSVLETGILIGIVHAYRRHETSANNFRHYRDDGISDDKENGGSTDGAVHEYYERLTRETAC